MTVALPTQSGASVSGRTDVDDGVFLDTNVYIDWADGTHGTLRAVLREANASVYLSPTVVLEALDDYWTCSLARLARAKKVLRLMLEHAGRMLPPEGATLRGSLGLDPSYSGPLSGENLVSCMNFCLRLTLGQRAARSDGERTFDVDGFLAASDEYREQYLTGREDFRAEILGRFGSAKGRGLSQQALPELRRYFDGADWRTIYVENLLKGFVETVNDVLVAACIDLIPSRLAFDTAVVQSMLIDGYNPRNHRGDCFDCGILTHLAESRLTLITADEKLIARTAGTTHGTRIQSCNSLLA